MTSVTRVRDNEKTNIEQTLQDQIHIDSILNGKHLWRCRRIELQIVWSHMIWFHEKMDLQDEKPYFSFTLSIIIVVTNRKALYFRL